MLSSLQHSPLSRPRWAQRPSSKPDSSIRALHKAAVDCDGRGQLPPLPNEELVETESAVNDLLGLIAKELPDATRQHASLEPTVNRPEPEPVVLDPEERLARTPISPLQDREITEELQQTQENQVNEGV